MNVTELLQKYRSKGLKIATAESCTGGLVGAMRTEIAGSSDVFDRGFITYSNAAKQDMLGVKSQTLETFGAVSPEVAIEMALGSLGNSLADVTVSITGIAGPGPSEHKPEGRVCFACATSQGCHSETVEFGPLGRAEVRKAAAHRALALLASALHP